MDGSTIAIILAILIVALFLIVALAGLAYYASFIPLYINAKASGVHCSIFRMIGMKLRRLNPKFIIQQMVVLNKAGVQADFDELESHIMAGGNLYAVVEAIVSAFKADLDVDFIRICAIDLAGRDVVRAVNACVNPIVITVPSGRQKHITGVARDGIRLGVNVKVTVRADIKKLVGGANEETISARVGEGIVSTIGSVRDHKEILENPDCISERILSRGLDSGTAFEIVSVDVGDVDVLDNIGAKLQEDQADADQQIAQAKAEARRALAVAAGHENRAKIKEMTALETLNESEVPKDMAAALRQGNVWVSPDPAYAVINRKLWDVLG